MKAKISFEIDVQDYVDDSDLTIPKAEERLKEEIADLIQNIVHYPDNFKIEIE